MIVKFKTFGKSEQWIYDSLCSINLRCKQKDETKNLYLLYKPEEAKTIKRVSNYCTVGDADYETVKLLLCKCKKKNLFIGVGETVLSAQKEAVEKAKQYYNKHEKELE